MTDDNNLKLYIHIPFCVRKCNYCDFLSFGADDNTKEEYVKALLMQIEAESILAKEKGYYKRVSSVYMGGGTPSCLESGQIKRIMDKIYSSFDIDENSENTIEVNPGTTTLCKLKEIKAAGFNRISIGMQSANDDELKELGRIHSFEEFLTCYHDARAAGFQNINVDVMTALEGQDEEKLKSTLKKVVELNPEHIAAYSLIIEEGTKFYEKYGDIEGPVIGQDAERELYHMSVSFLQEAGYEHYEISNFARKGYRSNHNCGYWKRISYLGLGLGAASLIKMQEEPNGIRLKNSSNLKDYLCNPMLKEEREEVSKDEAMDEFMFLGLRMLEGVDAREFRNIFDEDIYEAYGPGIDRLIREGLIQKRDSRLSLTKDGIDYGNYVFSTFLR